MVDTRFIGASRHAKAIKILRSAARALPISTAVTPATVTQGAASANSTIVTSATVALNGATIPWSSGKLRDISGVWTLDADNPSFGFIASHVSNKATGSKRANSNGAGKRFGFDGQASDVCTYGGPLRLCATDLTTGLRQWYSSDVTVSAAFIYTKFDFGSRAPRIIEVYFGGGASFWGRGFNVAPTDSVWAVDRPDEPKIVVFGDSYAAGTNNDNIRSSFPHVLGERLGCNIVASAVSGSGYLKEVPTTTGFTWRQRVANGDLDVARIGPQDLVFIWGSVNDGTFTDAAVQAEAALCIQAMMAAQPDAIIAVAGPQFTANTQTSTTRYAAVQAGVLAAANGDPRVIAIDNSPAGEGWQTGSGKAGATTGNGNNDLYMESAGTHWTAAGNYYGGRRIADSLIAKLSAMIAG